MKEKKKSRRERSKKKSLYGIVFAIVIFSIAFIYSSLYSSPNHTTNQQFQFKAAIVDHLSLTHPNQAFIKTAKSTLEQAGYTVHYYPGEEVTVELYRNLPTYEYNIIILRVHSGLLWSQKPPVALFTSEPYSKFKYVPEQLTDQIVWVFFHKDGPKYFGIRPEFVQLSMNGRFKDSTIIMMGCNGLTYTEMAKTFKEKGAKAYIAWSEAVSASHTDQATTQLLKHLIIEKQTIKRAVTETLKEVGYDPAYESLLLYYPPEAGDQTVEDITGNPKTNP